MNGFEAYSVQSWLIDCLTRHPPAAEESPPKKRTTSSSAITRMLSSLTACAALGSVSVTMAAMSLPMFGSPHTARAEQNMVVEPPAAYWSRAIAEVRSWPTVTEQEVTDPPLLF
jgi:hypothetical protein